MYTRLCQFLLRNRPQPPRRKPGRLPAERGQVLVIFAVSIIALVLFLGLALDAGSLYVTYGQLKRAVDAAAVAAANDFKRGETLTQMTTAAREVLVFHNVDPDTVDLHVYICDSDKDGYRDSSLQTDAPAFYARCPVTAPTGSAESPRKLVWLDAQQRAPVYFLALLGVPNIPLRTEAIAEAAAVDLVIVLDTSESMADETISAYCDAQANPTACKAKYVANFNPGSGAVPEGCNSTDNCQPLLKAKQAANQLIDRMYPGFDQVALVTFDAYAIRRFDMALITTANLANIKSNILAVDVHDDAPVARLWPDWYNAGANSRRYNPVNPDDRDGNGADADPSAPCSLDPASNTMYLKRWDPNATPPTGSGWVGAPCDDGNKLDAYNFVLDDTNTDGVFGDEEQIWTQADTDAAITWATANDPDGAGGPLQASFATVSTCTGCGIRLASDTLRQSGRPGAVWVIVFLSDGMVNLSDRPGTGGLTSDQETYYPNGFCSGSLNVGSWRNFCKDNDINVRYCIDEDEDTCPPSTVWTGALSEPAYTVYDYALDKADEAALTKSANAQEPGGNDIAIYTIGLGNVGAIGAKVLRYMANVGEDGDRLIDQCAPYESDYTKTCGQYYYTQSGSGLAAIFENIASRIYTRITQ